MAFKMGLNVFILAAIIFEGVTVTAFAQHLKLTSSVTGTWYLYGLWEWTASSHWVAVSVPVGESVNQNDGLVGIVGGHNVTIDKARFTAAILTKSNNSLVGVGAILNNRWILTTGYNFYDVHQEHDTYIRVGSTVLSKDGQNVQIQKIYIHPRYTGYWTYDIALVKLAKPLKFSKTVGPIARAPLPTNGTIGQLYGYGVTKRDDGGYLSQVSLPIRDYDDCYSHVSKFGFNYYHFCTIVDGVGPCDQDFGAPMVHDNKLVGLYMGTFYDCATVYNPAVYMNVGDFKTWIDGILKGNSNDGEVAEEDEDHFEDEE